MADGSSVSQEAEEWSLANLDPKTVKISKRKPRQKKEGSMNFGTKHTPKTISMRNLFGMVGGIVDTHSGDHPGTIKRPTERD